MARFPAKSMSCKGVSKSNAMASGKPGQATAKKTTSAATAAFCGGIQPKDSTQCGKPVGAAVAADGFAAAAPSPTTNEGTPPTSAAPAIRPGTPLYAAVVTAGLPPARPTHLGAPTTKTSIDTQTPTIETPTSQVSSDKEAVTMTTSCAAAATGANVNRAPTTTTLCKAPTGNTDVPSIQELLRERVQLTRQLEAQDAEAVEAANHLLAVSSERDAAESKAQDMTHIAALLESDLKKASAAAEEAAAKKAQDDAQALERQQVLEAQVVKLTEQLSHKDKKAQREQALEAKVAELTKQLAAKNAQPAARDKQKAAKNKQSQSAASAPREDLNKALAESLAAKVLELREQLAGKDRQLAAKAEEAKSAASAHEQELAEAQQEAERLSGALADCDRPRRELSAREADLAAARQKETKINKELLQARKESAKMHAFATSQTRKVAELEREKGAAEERAAAAATEKEERLRAAAEELQNALQKNEDLSEALEKAQEESAQLKASQAEQASKMEEMRSAMMAAQQQAALAIRDQTMNDFAIGQQLHAAQAKAAAQNKVVAELRSDVEAAHQRAAEAQAGARISHSTMAAALTRARAAETALSAAQQDMRLARAEAGAAQERMRLLQAGRNTCEQEVQTLRGQLMDLGAPEVTHTALASPQAAPSVPANTEDTHAAPATPDTAAASSYEGVHPLLTPEDAPRWTIRGAVCRMLRKSAVAILKACLPSWVVRSCIA